MSWLGRALLVGLTPALWLACQSAAPDAGPAVVMSDPACATQAVSLGAHPHAMQQPTADGRALIDVRGWHDRLYFGYGDLNTNTGPIEISSFDPKTGRWQDHLSFATERIQRFRIIGDSLYAPAADPHGAEPEPDVAIGTAAHTWTVMDVGPSLHVLDAVERAPGDVYLVGGNWLDMSNYLVSGYVWRSSGGGPFTQIFPVTPVNPQNQLVEPGTHFLGSAALDGVLYLPAGGVSWGFDGMNWSHGVVVGEFLRPTTFANRIVFDNFGELWAHDGHNKKNLGITLIPNSASYQFLLEPNSVFEDTEGHLIAVAASGAVLSTTDLKTWTCIGQAPPAVTAVGSLNGTVYFGAAEGRIWGYQTPSW